ncbi:MAG: gamma carbonic anhydrase family protein [Mogibacterium sp.]|nr:gamma carbonic anhydrase family protein [Mogibacterium sp.]
MANKKLYVATSADIVGDVTLGENSSVWYQAVIRGDSGPIVIGDNSNVQDGTVIHTGENCPVTVGDYVSIGHRAIIHGCTINDNCVIGMGAILLNGCVIGKNCMVGAGALVTQGTVIPDGSLVIGFPAKVKRPLSEDELLSLRKNADVYVEEAQAQLKEF